MVLRPRGWGEGGSDHGFNLEPAVVCFAGPIFLIKARIIVLALAFAVVDDKLQRLSRTLEV